MAGITDPTEAYFKDGTWGWDGTQWRKLALLWGYSDRWTQERVSTTGAAGTRYLSFTAVSANEVWVVQAVDAWNVDTNPSTLEIRISAGGVTTRLLYAASPGAGFVATWSGSIVLKEGDFVQVRLETCALNDDIWANVIGYKMKITE